MMTTSLLILTRALGAALVGTYFFRLLPEASENCRVALASEDPIERRQAQAMVCFIALMYGALWPFVVAFIFAFRKR